MRTKNVTRNLPVALGPEEIDQIATKGAEARHEAIQAEADLKAYSKEEKGRIGKLWEAHNRAQGVILTREIEREVPCIDQYEDETGMIYTVRIDTSEKVDERRMSEEERQTELLPEEGAARAILRMERYENGEVVEHTIDGGETWTKGPLPSVDEEIGNEA